MSLSVTLPTMNSTRAAVSPASTAASSEFCISSRTTRAGRRSLNSAELSAVKPLRFSVCPNFSLGVFVFRSLGTLAPDNRLERADQRVPRFIHFFGRGETP